MATAWEIKQANKVLVATLHVDNVTLAWSCGFRNLIIPGRDDLRRFNPFLPLSGMPFDHARNAAVQACLNVGAEFLFFLDSDVIPPKDTIVRLLKHELPVVSALYCRRSPPHAVPVMIKGTWVTDFPMGKLIEVELVGSGALLIHRSVFERMPHQRPGKPWFDWRVDQAGIMPPQECLSEDFTWCKAIREKLGIKIMVDTSIRCRHVGLAEADFGTFVPLNTTPNT